MKAHWKKVSAIAFVMVALFLDVASTQETVAVRGAQASLAPLGPISGYIIYEEGQVVREQALSEVGAPLHVFIVESRTVASRRLYLPFYRVGQVSGLLRYDLSTEMDPGFRDGLEMKKMIAKQGYFLFPDFGLRAAFESEMLDRLEVRLTDAIQRASMFNAVPAKPLAGENG